jgi:hypothetical protein
MRAFLISLAAMVVVTLVSVFALGAFQQTSGLAYSTEGTRVSSSYIRRMTVASMEKMRMKKPAVNAGGLNVSGITGHEEEETCEELSAWQAIFIDFSDQSEDAVACGS